MNNDTTSISDNDEIVVYKSKDGDISFDVNIFEETVWLTQKQIAELFSKNQSAISEHINNIYKENELDKSATYRKFRLVQKEGNRSIERNIEHYNLDVIISIGYRIKSPRGIQFRQWAAKVLKQYMINGYAVNEVKIRRIEESINDLVKSHKILKKDVNEIKDLLSKLLIRPIIIQPQINHTHQITAQIGVGERLEETIAQILDQIIKDLKDNVVVETELKKVKQDILTISNNPKSKKGLVSFLKELGDEKSDIHKAFRGADITQNVVTDLVKLLEKLKDLFF